MSFLNLPWGKRAHATKDTVAGLEAKETRRKSEGKDGLKPADQHRLDEARVMLRRDFCRQLGGGIAGALVLGGVGMAAVVSDDDESTAENTQAAGPAAPEVLDEAAFKTMLLDLENEMVRLANELMAYARQAGLSEKQQILLGLPAYIVEVNRNNAKRMNFSDGDKPRADLLDIEGSDSFFYYRYGALDGREAVEYGGLYDPIKSVLKVYPKMNPRSKVDLLSYAHELRHVLDIAKKLIASAGDEDGQSFMEDLLTMKGRTLSFLETELAAFATEVEMLNAISKGRIEQILSSGQDLSLEQLCQILNEEDACIELEQFAGGKVDSSNVIQILMRAVREGKFQDMKGFKIMILLDMAKKYYSDGPNKDCHYSVPFAKMVASVYSHGGHSSLLYEGQDGRAHELKSVDIITKEFLAGMKESSCLPQ